MSSKFFYCLEPVTVNGIMRKPLTANRIMASEVAQLMDLSDRGLIRFTDSPVVPVKQENATIQIAPKVHVKNRKPSKKAEEPVAEIKAEEELP